MEQILTPNIHRRMSIGSSTNFFARLQSFAGDRLLEDNTVEKLMRGGAGRTIMNLGSGVSQNSKLISSLISRYVYDLSPPFHSSAGRVGCDHRGTAGTAACLPSPHPAPA